MRNQPTTQATLQADEIKMLKTARSQLWSVLKIITVMSKSNHDDPLDFAVALEGVAELMSNALSDLENMSV